MEECAGRGIICRASTACRIRSMGERAKGHSECCLLFSHAACIQPLCTRTVGNALSAGRCPLRRGTHVKADAGNAPHHPSPSRLLAARLRTLKGEDQNAECDNQRRIIRRLITEKIPLFVLSAVVCIVTFVLQKRTAGAIPPLPFLWRAQNAFVSYIIYGWKTLWPARLAVFYPHPNDTLPLWEVIFAIRCC